MRGRSPTARSWLLIAAGAGLLLPAGVAVSASGPPHPPATALVAHVAGLLAGYLAVLLVVLVARVPFLEQRVGADVLTRWHARGARLFLGVVAVHAAAAVATWAAARREDVAASTTGVLALPGLLAAAAGTATLGLVVLLSVRALRRRLGYERWHLAHLLAYPAVVVTFTHELAGPDLAGRAVAPVVWSLVHVWALALVVRYRVLAPLELAWRHRLRVHGLVEEADGVVSVILRGRHLDELRVEAGQFFRWRFLTRTTWRSAHPFSLSALPEPDTLRITVKALGEGSRMVHALRRGTYVVAEGPSGSLTARRASCGSVLLVAGGVGIAPMRALLETVDLPRGEVVLLYRAAAPAEVIFRDELEAVARERGARLLWMIGPSSDPALAMTGENLRRRVPDVADRDVYLCASPAFASAVRDALREAGHPRRHLHEEVYAF